ncbi:MAG TPA: acetate--CoA ligase family protein [Acidimicrobiales bacterium]|nr:acetate--CoA ligase family protein [Acidimicrobiales bacterium]
MPEGPLDEFLPHAFAIDDGDRFVIPEPYVKQLLSAAGVTVPSGAIALDSDTLVDVAARLRAPLVLKAFGPGIVHKSDVGAVVLGLDHAALPAAAATMVDDLARNGLSSPSFYVEEQAEAGLELIIGATANEFGTAVVIGAGGTLTELLDDVALGLAPIDHTRALDMLRGFRANVLFDGHRGRASIDRDLVARMLVAIAGPDGVLARMGPHLREFEINPLIVSTGGAVAADARLVVAHPITIDGDAEHPRPIPLDALLRPSRVAVVGASTSRPGFGNRALAALRGVGRTDDVWAVHPTATEIDGVPAVASVSMVPGGADYLLIAVPAATCASVIREAAPHVGIAHVVSGGFAEVGPDGSSLEDELRRAARASGVRVLGPNCMGVYAPAGRQAFQLNVSRNAGSVTVLSQSGGLAGDVVQLGAAMGLRFHAVVSMGNCVDVTPGELLGAVAQQPETGVVGLYLEGSRDGATIVAALRALRGRLPMVAMVGGLSVQGRGAVASHTGSLAGDRRVWDAISRETGVTVVDDLERFLAMLLCFQRYRRHPANGNADTLIVGVGGGASVLATDACDAAGLHVRRLDDDLIAHLRSLGYGVGTSVVNPIEIGVGPAAPTDAYTRVLDPILERDHFPDVLLHVNVQAYYSYGTGGIEPLLQLLRDTAERAAPTSRLVIALRNADVAPCADRDAAFATAHEVGLPAYRTFGEAAHALAAIKRFAASRDA